MTRKKLNNEELEKKINHCLAQIEQEECNTNPMQKNLLNQISQQLHRMKNSFSSDTSTKELKSIADQNSGLTRNFLEHLNSAEIKKSFSSIRYEYARKYDLIDPDVLKLTEATLAKQRK